jgi:hypothetical protein
MRMSNSDSMTFMRFTNYVKHDLPRVADVPLIVANMKKFGSLSEAEFRRALQFGTDPSIIIKILPTGLPGAPSGCGADGLFVRASSSEINIELGRVQDFEAGPMLATDLNARGQPVIIVGVILLHELCHWGNFNHGVVETVEAGNAFCIATYGKRIPFFSRVTPMTVTP